ncbi:DUF2726 domain-containing protein [Candidatus Methylocalor cossyra]|uniref:DUF2726 domain-containing protein n=1 Tax=Candidatus Methylocalor cossyra TaxID=3108543 RepID=A0ABP1C4S8_9GAMM
MSWSWIGGIALVLLAISLFRWSSGRGGRTSRAGCRRREFLFSPEERLFYAALRQALGEDYAIFGKIRVGDLVTPSAPRGELREAFEAVADRPVTFVLCRPSDLSVACAVELKQRPFPGTEAALPGDPLKRLCWAAGLPLVRFEVGSDYEAAEIRDTIARAVAAEPLPLAEPDGRREPHISCLDNFEI